jgi:hypothetical protein
MSDINIDTLFENYALNEAELSEAERRAYNLRRLADDMKKEILALDKDGSCAIEFSDHAFKRIAEHIESLAMQRTDIFIKVFRSDSPVESVVAPSILKTFILALMAKARKDGRVTKLPSKKNAGSFEYHHIIEIEDWSDEDRRLIFTGIVENNKLKTGFFNWG